MDNRAPRDRGFTLIEMIIALSTMTLILGAAYTAMFAGLESYQRSAYESEVYTVLNRSMSRLIHDLTCAVVSGEGTRFYVEDDTVEDDVFEEIPTDRLRFQARLLRLEWTEKPQSDLAEVEFFVAGEDDEPLRWLVRRTESPADTDLEAGGTIHLVGPRVVGMNIELHNGSKWVSEWDSETELPQAVRIRLFMEPENRSDRPVKLETLSSIAWIPTAGGAASSNPVAAETDGSIDEADEEEEAADEPIEDEEESGS